MKIFITYITGNVSGGLCCNNGNSIFLHMMSFEQILTMIVGVVILNKIIVSVMLQIQ